MHRRQHVFMKLAERLSYVFTFCSFYLFPIHSFISYSFSMALFIVYCITFYFPTFNLNKFEIKLNRSQWKKTSKNQIQTRLMLMCCRNNS